ncbi:hypothetical protein V8E54_001451 [Elaphomyces granulatus]
MGFSESQLSNFQIAERTAAALSLFGCVSIFISYCSSPIFRKPIRRLIFYASFGNMLSAVGVSIGTAGVKAGTDSVLCQLQAFFIQQWIPADALWAFCMAFNLYLTIYRRYSAEQLRALEIWYFLACYGLPVIPSLTLFFIKTEKKGRIYGPATIWCSISDPWDFLRLVCFYGPVWYSSRPLWIGFIVLATLAIYITVGRDILRKRRALRSFSDPVNSSSKSSTGQETDRYQPPCSVQAEPVELAQSARSAEKRMNATIVNYARYSFIFFVALVVTWLPSSINRISNVVNPNAKNFGLNLTGALVLSLQGFWNAVIYFTTCMSSCKQLLSDFMRSPRRPNPPTEQTVLPQRGSHDESPFDGGSTAGSIAPPANSASLILCDLPLGTKEV